MTTVAEISGAVRRLPKRDLERFRKWFSEYDAATWDRQFARDVAEGRLNALAGEARREVPAVLSGARHETFSRLGRPVAPALSSAPSDAC